MLDEIQRMPRLFNALRVLADRAEGPSRFLILGSASPELVREVSESLAGRVEFIELAGFDLAETGARSWRTLWLRGGFPRSYLGGSDVRRPVQGETELFRNARRVHPTFCQC